MEVGGGAAARIVTSELVEEEKMNQKSGKQRG